MVSTRILKWKSRKGHFVSKSRTFVGHRPKNQQKVGHCKTSLRRPNRAYQKKMNKLYVKTSSLINFNNKLLKKILKYFRIIHCVVQFQTQEGKHIILSFKCVLQKKKNPLGLGIIINLPKWQSRIMEDKPFFRCSSVRICFESFISPLESDCFLINKEKSKTSKQRLSINYLGY